MASKLPLSGYKRFRVSNTVIVGRFTILAKCESIEKTGLASKMLMDEIIVPKAINLIFLMPQIGKKR